MQEMSLLFTAHLKKKKKESSFGKTRITNSKGPWKIIRVLTKKYSCQPLSVSTYRVPLRFLAKATLFQGIPWAWPCVPNAGHLFALCFRAPFYVGQDFADLHTNLKAPLPYPTPSSLPTLSQGSDQHPLHRLSVPIMLSPPFIFCRHYAPSLPKNFMNS